MKRNTCVDCKNKKGYDCLAAKHSYWDGIKGKEVVFYSTTTYQRWDVDFCRSWERKIPMIEKVVGKFKELFK